MESKLKSVSDEWVNRQLEILADMLTCLFSTNVIHETVHRSESKNTFYRYKLNFKDRTDISDDLMFVIWRNELLECDDEMAYEKFWQLIYYLQGQYESKKGRR